MGWLLILVIAILAVTAFFGYRKGMLKIVLSMLSIVVTLAAVCIVTPILSNVVKNHTQVYEKLYDKVEEGLHADEIFAEGSEQDIIDNIGLPKVIKELLLENNNVEKYAQLGVTTFTGYIVSSVTDVIFNTIIFVVSFVVVFIVVKIVFSLINLISKLPVINQVNKLAGILAGLVEGVVVVWIFFAVVTMLGSTEFGRSVFEQVNANGFLAFLYNNNLIMKYLLAIA